MFEHGTGHHASINGLSMYYEVHGTRRPLVMLHGALSTIDTDFGKVLPEVARTRQVIAIEQQGHGHTADIDRQLSYEQMAEDTVALLQHLRIEQADFFGYSVGGGVALQIAIRYPELVRKLVFAGGTSYSPDGLYPEVLEGIADITPDVLDGSPFQQAYARIAPNPENWPRLIAKIIEMDLAYKGWSAETIQSVKAPVLLMIGDADLVRPEHTLQMFRLLGGGVVGDIAAMPRSQLAILPGTSHITVMHRTDWLLSMVNEFLDAPIAA